MAEGLAPPSFQEMLVGQVLMENHYHGVDPRQALAEIKLLLQSWRVDAKLSSLHQTFLGKPFHVEWPEGKPPLIGLVLSDLKRHYESQIDALDA